MKNLWKKTNSKFSAASYLCVDGMFCSFHFHFHSLILLAFFCSFSIYSLSVLISRFFLSILLWKFCVWRLSVTHSGWYIVPTHTTYASFLICGSPFYLSTCKKKPEALFSIPKHCLLAFQNNGADDEKKKRNLNLHFEASTHRKHKNVARPSILISRDGIYFAWCSATEIG